jgi:hypothetical protein
MASIRSSSPSEIYESAYSASNKISLPAEFIIMNINAGMAVLHQPFVSLVTLQVVLKSKLMLLLMVESSPSLLIFYTPARKN